jgi:hypothetical protein
MPYGTDSFTDRYGDYKQPTVIDYDQSAAKVVVNSNLSVEESLTIHNADVEFALEEILSTNPFYAGNRYIDFVHSVGGKLAWNKDKINEMKSNTDWLLCLRQYLTKAKKKFIANKNL